MPPIEHRTALAVIALLVDPSYGVRIGGEAGERRLLDLYAADGPDARGVQRLACRLLRRQPRLRRGVRHHPKMTEPATNAELPGTFLVDDL